MFKVEETLVAGILVAVISLGICSQTEGADSIEVCGPGNGHGVGLSQYVLLASAVFVAYESSSARAPDGH